MMENTENRTIRFVDDKFKTMFVIPDGGKIAITSKFEKKPKEYECKYIDDYHFSLEGMIFHITQFAERMQANGSTYKPVIEKEYELCKIDEKCEERLIYRPDNDMGTIAKVSIYFSPEHSSSPGTLQAVMFDGYHAENKEWLTDDFRKEIYDVVNYFMDKNNIEDISDVQRFCSKNAELKVDNEEKYILKTETDKTAYYINISPTNGIYVHGYDKAQLNCYKDREYAKNLEIAEKDIFIVSDSKITELYYNPDSSSGGQVVENIFDTDTVKKAEKIYSQTLNTADFFDYINQYSKQYLYDAGTDYFRSFADKLTTQNADFEGISFDTMNGLIDSVDKSECKRENISKKNEPKSIDDIILAAKQTRITATENKVREMER